MSPGLLVIAAVAGAQFGLVDPAVAAEPPGTTATTPARIDWNVPIARVPFDVTLGRPAVDVRINGAGPFTLVLETTERSATLDDDVVRTLHLKPAGEGDAVKSNRPRWSTPDVARVESLDMGGAVIRDFNVVVRDYDMLADGERRYDGTLGLSLFASCLLKVDFPRQRLVLKQGQLPPTAGRDVLDYKTDGGLAVIPVAFGETTVDAAIDAGAVEAFVLDETLRQRIKLVASAESGKATDTGSDTGAAPAHFDGTVRIGRHRFVDPPVVFRAGSSLLGQRALQYFVVTIDQKSRRIRFSRSDGGPITLESPSKFGLVFETKAGRVRVKSVVPGSPAAQRGIRAGDVVLAIEGQQAGVFDEIELRRLLETSTAISIKVQRDGFPLLITLEGD